MSPRSTLFAAFHFIATILVQASEPPLMDWRFNDEPVLKTEIFDATGQVRGELWPSTDQNNDKLPALVTDDVPGGSAWDFGDSDCIFAVKPDNGIESLGDAGSTKGMAFAFWIKTEKMDDELLYRRVFGWGPVMDCYVAGRGLAFATLGLPEGSEVLETDQINMHHIKDAPAQEVLDGSWHHVVFSADFSSTSSNVVIYIDGDKAEEASVDYSGAKDFEPNKIFYIGGRLNGGNRWNGEIGRFQAWNRPLQDAEVAAIYADQRQTR